ncbi:Probable transmembrane protein [Alloactinosynnema sp. L-07]|uniref:hypothetical protein n=1 Tax=Alloactinosynnema sp. L-07 TaxID=1653480 RepID=UPI00065EF3C4|nr:hypothetical protein [Alloactinosynnema sp. L-07]CRK56567.1 Probable transmembrane protein [Alloactinosynnema sp. L-07]
MKTRVHAVAGTLGLVLITTFFVASVVVELGGDHNTIAGTKALILYGIIALVPSMMITGGSGRALMGARRGPRVRVKQKRMIVVAAIGLGVLTPSAILLQRLSAGGDFGTTFVVLQAVELLGGAINIAMMSLNLRDGMLLTGRLRRRRSTPATLT